MEAAKDAGNTLEVEPIESTLERRMDGHGAPRSDRSVSPAFLAAMERGRLAREKQKNDADASGLPSPVKTTGTSSVETTARRPGLSHFQQMRLRRAGFDVGKSEDLVNEQLGYVFDVTDLADIPKSEYRKALRMAGTPLVKSRKPAANRERKRLADGKKPWAEMSKSERSAEIREQFKDRDNISFIDSNGTRYSLNPNGVWPDGVKKGDDFNKIKKHMPMDDVSPPMVKYHGTAEQIKIPVAEFLKENPVVKAFDGRRIVLANPENGTIEQRAKHLIAGRDGDELDMRRANLVPAIPDTLRNASIAVKHRSDVIYYRKYRKGLVHKVVTDTAGNVLEHEAEGALTTQYPVSIRKERLSGQPKALNLRLPPVPVANSGDADAPSVEVPTPDIERGVIPTNRPQDNNKAITSGKQAGDKRFSLDSAYIKARKNGDATAVSEMERRKRAMLEAANRSGMKHRIKGETWWSYHTAPMQMAYNFGQEGIDLSQQPDFEGHRYGNIPESGASWNHADNFPEAGVSLAIDKNGNPIHTVIFMVDRPRVVERGILSPKRGSDGEALILPYAIDLSEDNDQPDVRYSITPEQDAEYLAAAKAGDTETAQRMVDEAAEKALKKEFDYHYTGHINSSAYDDYNKPGGLSWLPGVERNPVLLMEKDGVEYRQSGEELMYPIWDDAAYDVKRGADGLAVYMSDAEIAEKGLPKLDTDIVAYVDGKPIGLVSNEFGAVGVWVEPQFQGRGIGTTLLDEHMKQRGPKTRIGQMTNSGQNMVYSWLRKKQNRDPITYDDNGNIIPLSERFNEAKDDIRYSITPSPFSDYSDKELRSLLKSATGKDSRSKLLARQLEDLGGETAVSAEIERRKSERSERNRAAAKDRMKKEWSELEELYPEVLIWNAVKNATGRTPREIGNMAESSEARSRHLHAAMESLSGEGLLHYARRLFEGSALTVPESRTRHFSS